MHMPAGTGRSEFVARVLIVGLAIVLLWVLWSLRNLLIIAMGAIVFAILLRSLAEPIGRATGLGMRSSTMLAVLLVAGFLAAAGWLFGYELSAQFGRLAEIMPRSWADLQGQLEYLPFAAQILDSIAQERDLSAIIGFVMGLAGDAVTAFLLICFGAIFISAQPGLYRSGLLQLIPPGSRPLAGEALDDAGHSLRLWLLGQFISMVVVGVLTGVGLWLAGVPSPIALGLIAGLTEGIPYLGPIIGSIPGLLVALTASPETALWALVVYVAVQQIEGNTLVPIIQRKMVSLPPALTLFWIVAAGLLFGVLGLIFAAPILVVIYVLVKKLYVQEALGTETTIPGERDEPD
jgi:predicted PurR-regulated permease PerM